MNLMRTFLPRRCAVALVAVVVGLVLSGCGVLKNGAYDLPLPGGPDAGSNPKTVTVHFTSVDGLVPKSMVKVGNVAVGEVEDITVDQRDWTATVKCKIRNDVTLPQNAVAQVRRSSLLGEWFVELSAPSEGASAQPIADGTSIPLARTGQTAPVEEILGALSLLLSDGGVPQLNTIVRELNTAFAGRSGRLRTLLAQLKTFTGRLDQNKGSIVTALDSLDHLSKTLNNNRAAIAQALDELPGGVKVLAEQRTQLVTLVKSLGQLSTVATHVVESSKAGTVADLRALQPILSKLAAAGADLPNALQIMLTFPFTPGTAGAVRGDFVNLNTKIDLDASDLLTALLRGGLSTLTNLVPNPSSILGRTSTKHAPTAAPRSVQPSAPSSPAPSTTTTSGLSGLLGLLGLGGAS